MFAVVEIGGKQFTIKEQDEIRVPSLPNEVGDKVKFDRVMLIEKDGKTKVGQPVVEKALVSATVLDHGKEKKIVVFKKKRRKDYKKKTGHRQDFSLVKIESIKG